MGEWRARNARGWGPQAKSTAAAAAAVRPPIPLPTLTFLFMVPGRGSGLASSPLLTQAATGAGIAVRRAQSSAGAS